jgi:hydrogenase-4 component B
MNLFGVSLVSIVTGGLCAAVLARRPVLAAALFRLGVGAGCLAGAVFAVQVLTGAAVPEVQIGGAGPLGPWVFGMDALSALFLLAIVGVGAACAFYGLTYLDHGRASGATGLAHFLLSVLVAALAVTVAARAAAPFLVGWEVMAVSAYLLVVFEHDRQDVRRAGLIYLVATHTGTALLFVFFALWAGRSGGLTFAALAAHAPFTASAGAMILTLALLAFGVKAGIVPLHFWLPEAHAAAPSHVSAIMSGVVIKMGIYGLLRTVALYGSPPAWWGWTVLALGAGSGVLGVVWALAQHDLKRLLAFHSVENIGIILLGVGMGSLGLAYGHPFVAVLGFTGAALHTLNHAVFKSLLFLGAGSVIRATGTREIDRLGGLARRMPITAATFLVGSAAIVGLPPLNGFVSEWVVYQAVLAGGTASDAIRLAAVAAVGLAVIGALALACFVKVVGVLYLGAPRTPDADAARESGRGMTGPMVGLALACWVIGLLPVAVVPLGIRVGVLIAGATGGTGSPAAGPATAFILGLTGVVAVIGLLSAALRRRRAYASAATWGCGYALPTPRMAYTSSSFAAPLIGAFRPVAGIRVDRGAEFLVTHPFDPILDRVILPVWRALRRAGEYLRSRQRGPLPLHLLYVVVAVLSVLLYLFVTGSGR